MIDFGKATMLEAALWYAGERGWYVFPTMANKAPLASCAPNGVLDATIDKEIITKWWTDNPKANIGLNCGTSGILAFDLDPGSNLDELKEAVGDWRDTRLVAHTPRGGTHLFYELDEGENVRASASAVAKHIDIRSFHSYVLLSPSRTDAGTYTWEDADAKPAFRTDSMARVANHAREQSTDWDNWLIEPDLPENVDAAIKWLKDKAKISIEGQGGDRNAYATAAMMKSFGLSVSMAFDAMWTHWNIRCEPPWSPDEVDHFQSKVEHAYSYNTSPPGNMTSAYKIAKQHALFSTVEYVEIPSGRQRKSPNGRFRFVDRESMEHIEPPSWLIPDLIPEGGYAMLWGAPGTGKTFLALDIALSIAAGFPENPVHGQVEHPGPVLYAAGEARSGITNRVKAWEEEHWGGDKIIPFVLADPVPSPSSEDWDQFIAGARDLYPDGYELVVLDTVGRSMQGMNENTQEDASKFTRLVEQLQKELECAVLAIHHSGKGKKGARGSSVFFGDVDVMLGIEKKGAYVALTTEKQKDSEPPKPQYIRLKPVANSLVAVPGEQPPEKEKKEKPGEPLTDKKLEILHIYSKAILEILWENKAKRWSQNKLSIALSSRNDISTDSDQTCRKKIAELRGRNTVEEPIPAARCYDAATELWSWKDED